MGIGQQGSFGVSQQGTIGIGQQGIGGRGEAGAGGAGKSKFLAVIYHSFLSFILSLMVGRISLYSLAIPLG